MKWFQLAVALLWIVAGLALANAAPASEPSRNAGDDHPLLMVYGGPSDATLDHCVQAGVKILCPSITWSDPNDYLKSFVQEAHRKGVQVIPSLATAYDGYGDKVDQFAEKHPQYWEKRQNGNRIDKGVEVGLSFGYPQVRQYKVRTIADLVRRSGVDGVLLDYTRFFGNDAGYCDQILADFRSRTGRDARSLPVDDPQWVKFRAAYVTRFVAELRAAIREINPNVKIIACVGPDPAACLHEKLQDWQAWVDAGLVDGVTAMIYERDTNDTLRHIEIARHAIHGRVPFMPLIACWGGNLNTPELLRAGAVKCLQAGTNGVGVYRADAIDTLALWPTIADVSQLRLHDLRSEPIDYLLNGDFEDGLENWAVGDGHGVLVAAEGAHTGQKCLHFDFPAQAAARQLIDRGWVGGGHSIHVAGWMKTAGLEPSAHLAIQIRVMNKDGIEKQFLIPLPSAGQPSWRPFSNDVAIGNASDLKFIMISLIASAREGSCDFDDLSLSLSQQKVDPEKWRQSADAKEPAQAGSHDVDLLRGQIVRCSSFWDIGYEADHAVDGQISDAADDKGSSWYSQRPARNQWLKIYLPQTQSISRIRILNSSYQSAYRTRQYTIAVSMNDRDYHEVAHGVLPDNGTTWTEVHFAPVPARYVRFIGVTGYNLDYAVGLKEIEAY